jgi:apolipoprotein N-acyltransferase
VSRAARARPLVLALAGGLLEALALPLVIPQLSLRQVDPAGHLEWLAWVGLVPALFALDAARSARAAFGLGLAAGLAYFYTAIYWVNHAMTAFGGLRMGVALLALTLLVLYMAVHWAAAFAASWIIRSRLGWPLTWHLPVVWTAAELSRNYLFTGFPWGNLGYTQARHLTVSQLASLLGVYGIAALVVLVNATVHQILRARLDGRPFPRRAALATGLLLLATLAYGAAHLREVRARMASAPRLKVGLVQGNINQAVKNRRESYADFILGRFLPLTAEADRAGADLVAWPEATFPFLVPSDVQTFAGSRAGLQPLARAHLLLGASAVTWREGPKGGRTPEVTNTAFLVRPDLSVAAKYVKYHLVPFGEYVPMARWLPFLRQVVPGLAPVSAGRALTALRFPVAGDGETALAPMICFDAIFPEVNVAYAAQDPEFLVNPTNDAWYGYSSGPYQFLAIVRLRAIEAGKAVARPAYSGVTAIVLPTGEVAPGAIEVGPVDPELAPDPAEPPRLLLGEVPRLRGRTLYTKFGDLFAYACAALTILALGAALRRSPAPPAG